MIAYDRFCRLYGLKKIAWTTQNISSIFDEFSLESKKTSFNNRKGQCILGILVPEEEYKERG
jgi:hypothetical protein